LRFRRVISFADQQRSSVRGRENIERRSETVSRRSRQGAPSPERLQTALVDSWFDLHGHSLRDGERRHSKLDALAKRLRNPLATKLDPQVYAHDRRIRLGEGTSPKTLNNELGYLRSVYNELRGLGVIDYANPLALVKPLKIQEHELSWLTTEQIAELLETIRSGCDNPHVEIITLICLATGARWSEAEKLTPTGLRNAVITFSGTKSGKVRSVPITAELEAKIARHWKQHGQPNSAIT
jgi:integrase